MIKPITLAVVAVVATMGLLGGGYAVLRADEPTNHRQIGRASCRERVSSVV